MNTIEVRITQEPMNACGTWRGETIEANCSLMVATPSATSK
jgi:hypothetical protein